jgi:hypothetical protein
MSLEKQTHDLIVDGKAQEAEAALLRAKVDAIDQGDPEQLLLILDLLVRVSTVPEHRELEKADRVSLEREGLAPSAYSKLQTAMLRYWAAHDPPRAIEKAREAITEGRQEQDDSTVYSALSLLGLALIDIGEVSSASAIIPQIEQMLDEHRRFVVGDETCFLEAAKSQGLEVVAISRIAARLEPVCRDPEFAERLRALTKS